MIVGKLDYLKPGDLIIGEVFKENYNELGYDIFCFHGAGNRSDFFDKITAIFNKKINRPPMTGMGYSYELRPLYEFASSKGKIQVMDDYIRNIKVIC